MGAIGKLWIKDCAVAQCKNDRSRYHYHTINPRTQSVKTVEMTVIRAIMFVDAFEAWEAEHGKMKTWEDMDPAAFRKIYEDGWYTRTAEIEELFKRYKSGRLQREIVELAENLVLDDLSKERRKVIKDAIRRFSN